MFVMLPGLSETPSVRIANSATIDDEGDVDAAGPQVAQ